MEVIVVFLVVLLGSSIGTLTGFGLSTVMIPVMVLFYPLAEALLFVGIIHWFGDIWKIWLFKRGIRWRLWLAFGITGVLYSYLGAVLSVDSPEELMKRVERLEQTGPIDRLRSNFISGIKRLPVKVTS